jgi:hypothetical protein
MRTLKFIHVPRTGGTSIENHFYKYGINYGRYDKEYCDNIKTTFDIYNKKLGKADQGTSEYDSWHSILNNNSILWKFYDFFLVVRNPIDRLLSSYYHPFQPKPILYSKYTETVDVFNQKLNDILNLVITNPYTFGHYGLQINYINFAYLNQIHILLYDNFVEQLSTLCATYSIGVPKIDINSGISKKKFSVDDISVQNIEIFNTAYQRDIILYNTVKNYCYKDKLEPFDWIFTK